MAGRSGEKVKLISYEDLFQVDSLREITEIAIAELYDYKNHPFKVLDNEQMKELKDSIRENGILNPVLVRRIKKGYEIISGHRRKHAAELLGMEKIPVIIKELTDDESTVLMVDSNIQREEILPSERAFALKMKMDALSHQGTSRHHVEKLSCEEVGESSGMSGRQVQRYIRLTELLPELLEMVDQKKLPIMLAVEISFFDLEIQSYILTNIILGAVIRAEHIAELKQLIEQDSISQDIVSHVLNGSVEKKSKKNLTITEKRLYDYFPPEYSKKEMEAVIYNLLEQWKAQEKGDDDVEE